MNDFAIPDVTGALERAGLLAGTRGELPPRATGISDDSRRVEPGSLFIAVRGSARDGHDFLPGAAEKGAAAAIVEDPGRTTLPAIVVREGRRAAAVAAAAAYGDPARRLTLVAVTGTNGKTTTVGILRHLLDDAGARAASIGTLGVLLGSAGEPVPGGGGLTTPGPVELQRVLRTLVDAGVRRVAMEVSSHSLEQRRVEGLAFDAAVFTNLTRDHLDYHGTMESYFAAKAKLIAQLKGNGVAVVNAGDAAWRDLPPTPHRATFSLLADDPDDCDVRATDVRFTPRGSRWTLRTRGAYGRPGEDQAGDVRLPLIGDYNIENALGASAAAWALGMRAADIAELLGTLPQVPGRLEIIHERPTVLRDYAHTPDALERALAAVRPFAPKRLLVIFGAGGDRDRGKRPLMGAAAEAGADLAIVTSDNPRTEDPETILDDIERGMRRGTHERITDRRDAIRRALEIAADDDVILLAGKGHENYQIRGTVSYPFDERQVVRELVSEAR